MDPNRQDRITWLYSCIVYIFKCDNMLAHIEMLIKKITNFWGPIAATFMIMNLVLYIYIVHSGQINIRAWQILFRIKNENIQWILLPKILTKFNLHGWLILWKEHRIEWNLLNSEQTAHLMRFLQNMALA